MYKSRLDTHRIPENRHIAIDLQQILGVDLKTEGASNFDCIPDAWKFKEKPQKKGRKINNRRQR